MNIQRIKSVSHRAAMDAMNNGEFVTIIFYIDFRGKTKIYGQTFNKCHLQSEHK
jgi:hypothetical protein